MKDIRKNILLRMYIVYFLTVLSSFVIIGKIIHIQFVEGDEWRSISKSINYKYDTIPAIRGNIISADGKQLVLSKPVYDVFLDPWADYLVIYKDTFDFYIKSLADSLSKHFDVDKKKFLKRVTDARKNESKKVRAIAVKKNLNYEQMELMSTFPLFNKGRIQGGFCSTERYVTDYPFGTLAKRTLGIAENIEYGLNFSYNKELSGTTGKRYQQRISGGFWLPVSSDTITRIEPKNGYDVITTIDFKIQDFAENELSKKLVEHNAEWGCIVLMEVATGHIKAIANLAYDSATNTVWEKENYAVSHLIEPGSVIKLATLMTAFEHGYISANDTFDCEGGKIRLWTKDFSDHRKGGYGRISVKDIFKHSSNIGIVKIVEKYYNYSVKDEPKNLRKERQQKFIDYLKFMRLDKTVQTEIENEPTPRIPKIGSPLFSGYSLLQMSYGYEMMFTPLQTLTFYNAVANNGKMVKPMFVSAIKDGERIVKKIGTTVLQEQIASEKTLAFAKDLLYAVVNEKGGTAYSISNTKYYDIAGKTGTAKINHPTLNYDHTLYYISTFAGYFPADNPKYSCIVVIHQPLKEGYYGSVVSAPVFRAVADKVYSTEVAIFSDKDIPYSPDSIPPLRKGIQKDFQNIYLNLGINNFSQNPLIEWGSATENERIVEMSPVVFPTEKVPNVRGMSLKDAVYLLENMGFKVLFSGKGLVKSQSIEPGSDLKKGETISLTLSL